MNLDRMFNPGELRTAITLYSRSVTTGTGGFRVPGRTKIADVWARWENVHGSEVWAADAQQAEQAATVVIRYRSGLDLTCVVGKGTEYYEIVSMDDVRNLHRYIELKVKRLVDG